jgi:glycerate 2-kinase
VTYAVHHREILRGLFDAAIAAVDPLLVMPRYLERIVSTHQYERVVVIGAGKAAARMALAVEQHWPQRVTGLVVTRYGHNEPCQQIEVIEAGHPVPDDASVFAAERMLELVRDLSGNDLVLSLISGGGSSLLTLPASGLLLEDKREVNKALLACGATISEMNVVRRHLSQIKGGKLGLACKDAKVITLVISDVPNDAAAVVASGPTIADSSTATDAEAILLRYGIRINDRVSNHFAKTLAITPQPSGRREQYVIASAQNALDAAAAHAREAGITPLVLGGSIEGEARDVASVHAGIARQVRLHAQPCATPCVILSGGESTVTMRGDGRGGRNAEFLLALAIAARDVPNLFALACDTDGIDGSEDNAGAVIDPTTLQRAQHIGLDAYKHLMRNDAYSYFLALNQLIFTGPTRTNVNDFRAILLA